MAMHARIHTHTYNTFVCMCVAVHSIAKKNIIVTANRMTAFENNFIHPFEHFN